MEKTKEKVRKFLKEHSSFENYSFMLCNQRMQGVGIARSWFGYAVTVFEHSETIETFKDGEEEKMVDWIIDTLVENPQKHEIVNLITLCAMEFNNE